MEYNFKKIEKKWQDFWYTSNLFAAQNDTKLPKYYPLVEFPYPSGAGLHVGHPRSYIALDIVARKRRMQGFNVLYCMGWDAFGLPTENYAIKNKIHPKLVNKRNVAHFKEQIKSLGLSFDWSREIDTTDENYYRWTQWIFLQLFKHGLAYKSEATVNWCTKCKVVLANEEVVNGCCERCSGQVVKKNKSQWMLKITEYAQRLLDDLELVDYPQKVKLSQINWIGRSEGAEIKFKTTIGDELEVYTTRPDTIFGATYMVVAPEHKLIQKWLPHCKNAEQIKEYINESAKKSDLERTDLVKEKTGVKLEGIMGVNPVNNKEIPIFIADYVLVSYGTGVIMAVPAHDERDWEFAKKYNLPIIPVISGGQTDQEPYTSTDAGQLINSGFLNGLSVADAKEAIINWLKEKDIGNKKVNFKLRDWIFSRQRYWGEPIPIVHCKDCGCVPLNEADLPLKLPEIESYEQTDTGESPLSKIEEWVNCKCPKCGKPAQRETDTMPQWAGSSWYFLRYCDPHNQNELASQELLKYWLSVDWYNGGMEHTTLHLLYSRFWHKFLYDIGVVPTVEPYAKRTSHGLILGEHNEKMSKSKGNVVNPDDIIAQYGADTMRLYEMFLGDFETAAPWSTDSIKGCKRFLDRVFNLQEMITGQADQFSKELEVKFNKAIKKVSQDIETLKFNTAIATLMSLLGDIYKNKGLNTFELKIFLQLLCVFAPHISEEIWSIQKFEGLACKQTWPQFDEDLCKEETVEIAVQINGKIKARIEIAADLAQEEALVEAKKINIVEQILNTAKIKKEIYVKGRLINFVLEKL
ncbi:MAG: leucine--tRNA ligase [Oscillospiraceae bacterium]|nr:leucine--tRNA ligase [Oscillospiraceae bacterium]